MKRCPIATKPPLQEQNQENSKNEGDLRMSFPPGTCATTTKKEEMIKRLEKRRSQRKSMIVSTKPEPAVNPKLDPSLIEQALMTQREIFTDVQQLVHEIVEMVAFEEEERRRQLAELTIVRIQALTRGLLSRKLFNRKLEALKEEKQRFVSNIVTVQSLIRRFLAKQKFLVLKRDKDSRLAAESTIISLQPLALGALGRRKFADFRANVNKRRNEAANIIQCLVRKYQAHCPLQTLKVNYAEAQRCRMQTIITLQADAHALKRFCALKEQKKRLVESVIKLQACSRRYLAIKKLAALKEKRKEQQQNLEQPFQCSDGNCEEPIAQRNLTSRPGSLHDILNLEVDEVDMEGLPPLKRNLLEIDPVSKQYLGAIGVRIINDFMEKEIEKIRHQRETAAIKIQSWYRGVSKRNAMSSIIESRKNNMEAYMNEAALQERVEEDVEEYTE